jgi:hypothetical protein
MGGVARIDGFFSGARNGKWKLPGKTEKEFLVFAGCATATRNLWWQSKL